MIASYGAASRQPSEPSPTWQKTFGDAVFFPIFSPDGNRVAAIVIDNDRYTIAVDGKTWDTDFDMLWNLVFSPDGGMISAKAELNGRYMIVVDGRIGKHSFDELWDPVFSPDGTKLLVKCVEDGKYYRRIAPVSGI